MNKTKPVKSLFLLTLVFTIGFAMADSITVSSDTNTLWSSDNTNWNPTYLTWKHPAWPLITDDANAYWIWRTNQTNPQEEYANVPDGGWYFKRTFDIPECVNTQDIAGVITAASDNAYQLYVNGVYVDGRGVMNKNGPDALTWKLKTDYPLSGLQSGENEIVFRAMNYFNTGNYQVNPAGLIFSAKINYTIGDNDLDTFDCNSDCNDSNSDVYPGATEICNGIDDNCDGQIDEGDICGPQCTGEENAPESSLGTNRWSWDGDSWITTLPKSGKSPRDYNSDLSLTHGCSCSEILTWLNTEYPEEFGNMEGHWKYGCSISVMDEFISLTA